jgi:hypothetical protein
MAGDAIGVANPVRMTQAHRRGAGWNVCPSSSAVWHQALLKMGMLTPLRWLASSLARKKRVCARSSGVMPAFNYGAAWRSISVSTAPGLTASTRML